MKLYVKSLLILVVITAVGVGGYYVWHQATHPAKAEAKSKPAQQPTVDDLINDSVDTESITTNFADGGFIKAQFKLITTSQTNADQIKKLNFRIEDTIIQAINQIKKGDATGPKGFTLIENNVRNDLNKALGGKYITRVYLVDKLIQ